ncbi:interferon gamma related isoform X2 [Alosa sapidissima]|nr:interferon gamma related isoform X2 [Alosa sapidissima]
MKNLTDTERQVDGSIFKEQLQKMEKHFGMEEQRLLVLEMLDVYSHLFKQMSKEADRQGSHEAKALLHYIKRLDEYPTIKKDNDQLKMLRDIRARVTDYKWSPAEQLKALNDFQVVYQKATELAQSKSN